MPTSKSLFARCFIRWRNELRTLLAESQKEGSWAISFESSEVSSFDIQYSAFLVALSFIPAAIVTQISTAPDWKVMAQFFGTPIQAIIAGFLMSTIFFLGSHFNKKPKSYSFAYKAMLRVLSLHPVAGLLLISDWGAVLILLIYAYFVARTAAKAYGIPAKNAYLFYGVIYVIFALLQLQALLKGIPG